MRLIQKILTQVRVKMFESEGGLSSLLLLFAALMLEPHLQFDDIGAFQETLNRFRSVNLGRRDMKFFVNLASQHLRRSAGQFGWLVYL